MVLGRERERVVMRVMVRIGEEVGKGDGENEKEKGEGESEG
jgi:hypothetical protein